MGWTEFFKPDQKKILVVILLLFLTYLIQKEFGPYKIEGSYDIAFQNLVIDLFFWYVLSCLAFDKEIFILNEERIGLYFAVAAAAYIFIGDLTGFMFFFFPFLILFMIIHDYTKNLKKSILWTLGIGFILVFLLFAGALSSSLH